MPINWQNCKLYNLGVGARETYNVIPDAVNEALSTLKIYRLPSFWKVVSNRGRITVVLHWDHCSVEKKLKAAAASAVNKFRSENNTCNRRIITNNQSCSGLDMQNEKHKTVAARNSFPDHERNIQDGSFADYKSKLNGHSGLPEERTRECDDKYKHNCPDEHQHSVSKKCEFHCGSLHEKGRSILSGEKSHHQIRLKTKSLSQNHAQSFEGNTIDESTVTAAHQSARVKFVPGCSNNESDELSLKSAHPSLSSQLASKERGQTNESERLQTPDQDDGDSEDSGTSEKVLFLIDQTLNDQHSHLTIFDLGVIFERLKSKIIDVHRLEREIHYEDPCSYRWNIQATIRGDVLRELGVLYNGNYYSISEAIRRDQSANGLDDENWSSSSNFKSRLECSKSAAPLYTF